MMFLGILIILSNNCSHKSKYNANKIKEVFDLKNNLLKSLKYLINDYYKPDYLNQIKDRTLPEVEKTKIIFD